jgi:hypothetical protein
MQDRLPQPDDSEPGESRRQELDKRYQENIGKRPPYFGVPIQTRGELLWIMKQRDWSGEIDKGLQLRPDLRGAELGGIVLGDANLNGADLSDARLGGAYLHGANLFMVNLANADLRRSDLSGAYLPGADLSHTDLEAADLQGAHLIEVNLSGAYMDRTDLRDADLWSARFDVTTMLRDVVLNNNTRLGDVVWNNVPLTQIDWTQIARLGDESVITEAEARMRGKRGKDARETVAKACRKAERAYRALAITLRQQGLADAAKQFRLCELELERKALKLEGKRGQLYFSRLLNLVSGHGERPGNAFFAYVSVILSFTGIYWLIWRGPSARSSGGCGDM